MNVAGATGVGGQPLAVQSASLTQNGEQLVWQLQISEPFSPEALARDRRALCLLVERADNGAVTGQLCLVGPRKGRRAPQVRYASVINGVRGRGRAIDATITRDSNRDLTASFLPSGIGAAYKPVQMAGAQHARPACVQRPHHRDSASRRLPGSVPCSARSAEAPHAQARRMRGDGE